MSTDTDPMSTLQQAIIDTWFKDDETGRLDLPQLKRWFNGGKTLDDHLRAEYSDVIDKAAAGEFDDWMNSPTGSLALLLLLDQFSRNIYRGSAKAFAFDKKAQTVCLNGLAKGFDQALPVMQRVFFYLPLEHAETDELQIESIKRSTAMHEQSGDELKVFTRRTLEAALEHKEIVDQFGRYPHRNAALGRTNTAEEELWLKEHSKSFGQ